MTFLPSILGRFSTKVAVSFAGLLPSTGVPKMSSSQFAMADGGADAKS
jgi:hypothetical protein